MNDIPNTGQGAMVTMPIEEFERLRETVTSLACGYKRNRFGAPVRVPRIELVEEAREVCVRFGWPFALEGGHRRGPRADAETP